MKMQQVIEHCYAVLNEKTGYAMLTPV